MNGEEAEWIVASCKESAESRIESSFRGNSFLLAIEILIQRSPTAWESLTDQTNVTFSP